MWQKLLQGAFSVTAHAASVPVVSVVNPVDIVRGDQRVEHEVLACMSTTEEISSIDRKLARDLGLLENNKVIERIQHPRLTRKQFVDVIQVRFTLGGEEKTSLWYVEDRQEENILVQIGKTDLSGFLVKV